MDLLDSEDLLDVEIRSRLGSYLRREDTLEEFTAWFTPATWDVHESGNELARELTYRIAHLLGDYSTGAITSEGRLRSRLRPLANTYFIEYVTVPRVTTSTTFGSAVLRPPLALTV